MVEELKVLIDESIEHSIKIKDEVLAFKKLSLKQVIQLTKILTKTFGKYSSQVKNLNLNNQSNAQDVLELFNIIDESEVAEIIAILTGKPVEYCLALGFKEITDVVTIVIDINYNDFASILKNFQRISSRLQTKIQ